MFQLLWEQVALDELAQLWLNLDQLERTAVNFAIEEIEILLKERADSAGESRARPSERVLIHQPLGLFFNIEYRDRQRTAVIQHVWPIYKASL